jgi:hypothetical protein
MKRRTFALSLLAGAALPRPARATGGLDVGETVTPRTVRVLLASGDGFAEPQRLDSWRFGWNGRTYRGVFGTIVLEDGRRGLLNTVPLDAYLYGVLGAEISAGWPAAAQAAQAVAARTFALSKLRPQKSFDVVAGDADQHYGGIEAESVEGRDGSIRPPAASSPTTAYRPTSPSARVAADVPPTRATCGVRPIRI